jgi:hypothetical protein
VKLVKMGVMADLDDEVFMVKRVKLVLLDYQDLKEWTVYGANQVSLDDQDSMASVTPEKLELKVKKVQMDLLVIQEEMELKVNLVRSLDLNQEEGRRVNPVVTVHLVLMV